MLWREREAFRVCQESKNIRFGQLGNRILKFFQIILLGTITITFAFNELLFEQAIFRDLLDKCQENCD